MKKILTGIALLSLVLGLALPVLAADTGTVTATVCPKLISVTVSQGTVAYGIKALGATNLVPTPTSVTLTNNGNVAETLSIKGGDATTTDGTWTLGATVGANQYVHRSSPEGTTFTALTAGYVAFAGTATTKVGAGDCAGAGGGTKALYLNMDTPTSTSVQGEYSAPVTILATE